MGYKNFNGGCPRATKFLFFYTPGNEAIYNTGARGVLLALGFEEIRGHMECGPGGGRTLGMERMQQISDAMLMVHETLKAMEECTRSDGSNALLAQPLGSDGFGRAGFGYAGEMNI